MNEETKLMLSADELALAKDRDIILTKRAITEKAFALLAQQQESINDIFRDIILGESLPVSSMPKISKGENYKGFPYVIMDHPAVFGKENVFALRTMFWWGHFLSINLHLSGEYCTRFRERVLKNISPKFYISVGDDEWDHDLSGKNYTLVSKLSSEEKKNIETTSFLKVALRLELEDWNNSAQWKESYKKTARLLHP